VNISSLFCSFVGLFNKSPALLKIGSVAENRRYELSIASIVRRRIINGSSKANEYRVHLLQRVGKLRVSGFGLGFGFGFRVFRVIKVVRAVHLGWCGGMPVWSICRNHCEMR